MKRLLVFRHGKSDWEAAYGSDHSRPLASRGRLAAQAMGRVLAKSGEVPEVVITSSAVRARTTAELAIEAGAWRCRVETTDALYGTSPEGALKVAAAVGDDPDRMMLVGHEPTWSALVGHVTGARVQMKTATVAGIDLAIGAWREAGDVEWGELVYVLQPRLFTDGSWELA